MVEIKNVRQKAGDPFRRWFSDNYFDLIIWYNDEKEIIGFQLCYDVKENEKAITYSDGKFSHNKIDQGEDNPSKNRTPILVADGVFDELKVLPKFEESSKNLENGIKEYVSGKIAEYVGRMKSK
jgi:hypothetical protein